MSRSMYSNPHFQRHLDGEMEFTGDGYSRKHAAALVRSEYSGHTEPDICGACGGEAWYKATVGANVCPHCGAVEVPVWVDRETGEEHRGCSQPREIAARCRVESRWV